jgi:hypothetical protein
MIAKADRANLKIVFIPARSDTKSDAMNLSKIVLPLFLDNKEKVNLLFFTSSGVRAETNAPFILIPPSISTVKVAKRTFEPVTRQELNFL